MGLFDSLKKNLAGLKDTVEDLVEEHDLVRMYRTFYANAEPFKSVAR